MTEKAGLTKAIVRGEEVSAQRHIPSRINPRISLHQEWVMRTGGYDDIARLEGPSGWTTFTAMVEEYGLDGAIRAVVSCMWLSETDCYYRDGRPCVECLEVAHA